MGSNNVLRNEAFKLRLEGWSYTIISKRIGVNKSTLSGWLKNLPYVPNATVLERVSNGPIRSAIRRHNEKLERINRIKSEAYKEIGSLSKRELWLIGIALYIGEGNKNNESIRFVNSDPYVIGLVMRWFREICSLEDANFSASVHMYPDTIESEAVNYWSRISGIVASQFRKSQIDRRSGKRPHKANKLPYGTLQITILSNHDKSKGVDLHRKITGWMEGVLETNAGII